MRGSFDAKTLLRAGLLEDLGVLIAGGEHDRGAQAAGGEFAAEVASACGALGARLFSWPQGEAASAEREVPSGVDRLIIDGAALFARGGLGECLAGAWDASHAVGNAAFIQPRRRGRIIYLAPRSSRAADGGGEHVAAARAGLENLARTLSIEWARYEITTVTIAPGASTPAAELAALCAYLCSPAGDYFSGCRLELGAVEARRASAPG